MVCIGIGFTALVVLVVVAIIYFQNVNAVEYKTVETNYGKVRGRMHKTFLKQKPYFAFKGIPFAKPPIGADRFKIPQPVDSWKPKTIDAFNYQHECMQIPKSSFTISEDCLYINVFTPEAKKYEKLAVIVYVYGGEFLAGDLQLSGPDLILDENVIFVTFNYRLGVFGFVSFGTRDYPGNMGLKDQRFALKWVHENIEHFGGDRQRVTFIGHSAGAISVLTHLFNSESRKYFQRVQSMSGALLRSYPSGNHKCILYEMARISSQPIKDDNELIEFFKQLPAQKLQDLTLHPFFFSKLMAFATWGPVIEGKNAIQPILPEDPFIVIEKEDYRNLSFYFSHTDKESYSLELAHGLDLSCVKNEIKTLNSVHLPLYAFDLADLANKSIKSKPYFQELFNKLRARYLTNVTNDYDLILEYSTMKSDLFFNFYIDDLIQVLAPKSASIFYSRFSVDSKLNYFKHEKEIDLPGATHSDDICYVFWCYAYEKTYKEIIETKDTDPNSAIALKTIFHMTKLFSNFVKYGNPTVNGYPIEGFQPVRGDELNFLDVTNDGLFLDKKPSGDLVDFVNYFRKEALRLIIEHDDLPKMNEFDVVCREYRDLNANRTS